MTEAEWLVCVDPRVMYPLVEARMTTRQRRAFSCACGRRHCCIRGREKYRSAEEADFWLARKLQLDAICERILDAAEDQNDGADRSVELASLCDEVFQLGPLPLCWELGDAVKGNVEYWLGRVKDLPDSARRQAMLDPARLNELHDEAAFQADLLRCVVGNPFKPVSFDADLLKWNREALPKMALKIYDKRTFELLPILADVLQEAGCRDQHILEHCRGPVAHVRGCWVLDLLLCRE